VFIFGSPLPEYIKLPLSPVAPISNETVTESGGQKTVIESVDKTELIAIN
jgi:hypothetical protein